MCVHLDAGEVDDCTTQYQPVSDAVRLDIESLIPDQPWMVPLLARLAWHSAGTYNGNLSPIGGTNGGCIRMDPEKSDDANANLKPARELVDGYRNRFPWVSVADMIQLAAALAHDIAGCPGVIFTPGRIDFHYHNRGKKCSPNGRLPPKLVEGDPHPLPRTQELVLDKFAVYLGGVRDADGEYSDDITEQVVALMGGHTLGGMHLATSGNEGNFTRRPYIFDNEYFLNLVGMDWNASTRMGGSRADGSTRTDLQYRIDDITLLPVDIAVVTHPGMFRQAQMFAANNTRFIEAYVRAWDRLAENGLDRTGLPATPTPAGSEGGSGCTPSSLPIASMPGTSYACSLALPVEGLTLHWRTEENNGQGGSPTVYLALSSTDANGWLGMAFPDSRGSMLARHALVWASGQLDFCSIVSRSLAGLVPITADAAAQAGLTQATREIVNGEQVLSVSLSCGNATGACAFDPSSAYISFARDTASSTLIKHTGQNKGSITANLLLGVSQVESQSDVEGWRRTHGYLMSAATLFVFPSAMSAKRYGKRVFGISDSSRLPLGPAFVAHIALVTLGFGMVIYSVALAMTRLSGTGSTNDLHYHRALGVAAVAIMGTVVCGGITSRLLPRNLRPARLAHAVLGIAMVSLMAAQVVTGVLKLRDYQPQDDVQFSSIMSAGFAYSVGSFLLLETMLRCGAPRAPPMDFLSKKSAGRGPTYSRLDVQSHGTAEDPWLIIEGRVYSVKGWPESHPGGEAVILGMAGKDATERFHSINHSSAAMRRLKEYYIGEVEGADIAGCIDLVGDVAECLVSLDIDMASRILTNEEKAGGLPQSLILKFQELLVNLDEFKPYLPESLLESLGAAPREDEIPVDANSRAMEANPPEVCVIAFTDVQSSTNLWEMTPSGMKHGLAMHNEIIRSVIRECNGYEVKTIGDAFMVAFVSSQDAVRFGLTVQEELVKAEWHPALLEIPVCKEVRSKTGSPVWGGLRVRIGMHIGPVDAQRNPLTGRLDFFGSTVNKAARVESKSVGGALCITEELLADIQGSEVLRTSEQVPLGLVKLKGVKESARLVILLTEALVPRKSDVIASFMSTLPAGISPALDTRESSGNSFAVPITCDRSFVNTKGSIAAININVRSLTTNAAPAFGRLVVTMMEHIQKTEGIYQTVCGSLVLATWNIGKRCKEHTVQSVRFAALAGVVPYSPDASGEVQRDPMVAMGIVSGTCHAGAIGRRNQKSHIVIGPTVDLSLRLAARAAELDCPCLTYTMKGCYGIAEDKVLSEYCRIADVWSPGGEAGLLLLAEVNTPLLKVLMTSAAFAVPDERPGIWGNCGTVSAILEGLLSGSQIAKGEVARMYQVEGDRATCRVCKQMPATLCCESCGVTSCAWCPVAHESCDDSHSMVPNHSHGSLAVLRHMASLLGGATLAPSAVFEIPDIMSPVNTSFDHSRVASGNGTQGPFSPEGQEQLDLSMTSRGPLDARSQ